MKFHKCFHFTSLLIKQCKFWNISGFCQKKYKNCSLDYIQLRWVGATAIKLIMYTLPVFVKVANIKSHAQSAEGVFKFHKLLLLHQQLYSPNSRILPDLFMENLYKV